MNRAEFRQLAELRLTDAQALLGLRRYAAAYYLGGYVIECALKACIARQFQRANIPDSRLVSNIFTHDLARLLRIADLEQPLLEAGHRDRQLELAWGTVLTWNEATRYEGRRSPAEAVDLIRAIAEPHHGVFPWLRHYW